MNNPLRRLIPALWPCSKTNRTRVRRQLSRAVAACAFERLEGRQLLSVAIDVRLAGGGNALTITDAMLGQPIQMEIWARTIGSLPTDPGYTNLANDGLQSAFGSILSTNTGGGGALGSLSASLEPFYTGASASSGGMPVDLDDDGDFELPADLDGDGDLDVGSYDNGQADGFVFVRHDPPNDGAIVTYGNAILDGQGRRIGTEQKVGTVTFTLAQMLQDGGMTSIVWRTRPGTIGASWWVDYQPTSTNTNPQDYQAGSSVVLTYDKPDTAPPAAVISALDFSTGGQFYNFTVTYTDDKGLNLSTIDNNDVVVRRDGIGYLANAQLVGPPIGNQLSATATYRVPAPGGGFWTDAANGMYTVELAAGAVLDVVNKPVAGQTDTFEVNIVPDNVPPTSSVQAGPVTSGRNFHTITVTFSDVDGLGIEPLTIDGDEIIVTAQGSATPLAVTLAGTAGDRFTQVATYNVTGPTNGSWVYASNGMYDVTVVAGSVKDSAGNDVIGSTGSFESIVPLDEIPPTGAINAPILTAFGGSTYIFSVVYSDNIAINVGTIGDGDIVVYGPHGFFQEARLLGLSAGDNGTPRTATYTITAPNFQWDGRANGFYSAYFVPGAVADTSGFSAEVAPVTFQVAVPPAVMSGANLVIYGSDLANTVTLSGTKALLVTSVDGVRQSFLKAGLRRIYVFGYGGNDVITVGKGVGAAYLYGGAGNDVITGGVGADVIFGDDGNDIIKGGLGNDNIRGGAGNDRLYGDAGNDKIVGDAGVDRLYGQDGDDILTSTDAFKDILDGGRDSDTARADVKDFLKNIEATRKTKVR